MASAERTTLDAGDRPESRPRWDQLATGELLGSAVVQALLSSTSIQVGVFDGRCRPLALSPAMAAAHPGLVLDPDTPAAEPPDGVLGSILQSVVDSGLPVHDVDLAPDGASTGYSRATITPLADGRDGPAALLYVGRHIADLRETVDRLRHPFEAAPLPTIPGMSVAAVSRPASDPFGGDVYDVFPTGNGAWIATVADVVGHDAHAAAVTVIFRTALRALAVVLSRPAQLLDGLHRLMVLDDTIDRSCTAVAARLRVVPEGVRVTVARAGHPYPVLVPANGAMSVVAPVGTMLGAAADGSWEEIPCLLRPGDALILCSDGVAGPTGELLSVPGCQEALHRMAGRDATTIASAVSAVAEQRGDVRDDETILVVQAQA